MIRKVTLGSEVFRERLSALLEDPSKVEEVLDPSMDTVPAGKSIEAYWQQKATGDQPTVVVNVKPNTPPRTQATDHETLDWSTRRACKGNEFKLEPRVYVHAARKMCRSCTVVRDCLADDMAFLTPSPGIKAGLSQEEREALLPNHISNKNTVTPIPEISDN
jgi:hypothetical protein